MCYLLFDNHIVFYFAQNGTLLLRHMLAATHNGNKRPPLRTTMALTNCSLAIKKGMRFFLLLFFKLRGRKEQQQDNNNFKGIRKKIQSICPIMFTSYKFPKISVPVVIHCVWCIYL